MSVGGRRSTPGSAGAADKDPDFNFSTENHRVSNEGCRVSSIGLVKTT